MRLYLPRILRVAAADSGAKAISYATWSVWISDNGSTAAYALVAAPNWALFAVNFLNALGRAAVVALTAWKPATGDRLTTVNQTSDRQNTDN